MSELAELRKEVLEMKFLIKLLMPKNYTISYIAQLTGKTRQAVREWLLHNAEPDVDFWQKNGKIYVSEQTALKYISGRRNT